MKRLACCLAALELSACGAGEPPREVRLEVPDVITSKDPVLVHVRALKQDGTPRDPGRKLEFRVTPPELASVGKGGVLICNRSGDGSLALTVAGVEGRAKLACKLAARIEAPIKLSIDAAKGEQQPDFKVLDATGKELDLPLTITSDQASVLLARAGRLVPGRVGLAKLTLRAGQLTRSVEAEVVRTLAPEVLPIDQNRRISYSVDAGKYRLSFVLPSPQRVSIDWLGAPYCAYRGSASEHRVDCTLQHKGSVSFDNPAFLLRGEKTPSVEGVTLQEVP
jgi:plasmid stability protein